MAEVVLLCGKAGTNKMHYAEHLKKEINAVVLSCDELMFTLYEDRFGMKHNPLLQKSKIYLVHLAEQLVGSGSNVIMDLDLWSAHERKTITQYFAGKGIVTQLHYIKSPDDEQGIGNTGKGQIPNTYFVDSIVKNLFEEDFEEPDEEEVDVLLVKDQYHKRP